MPEVSVLEMEASVSERGVSVPETATTFALVTYTRNRVDWGWVWPLKEVFSNN